MASWYLNEQYLIVNESLPQDIPGDIITPPYPASFWELNSDDMIVNGLLAVAIDSPILVYPYPASLWWLDDDNILLNMLLPEPLELIANGAFLNAQSLEYVKIPKSVTSIGYYAFQGTKLKKVMLSKKCVFSSSAFPFGCEILFYEDQFDQNYDILIAGENSYRYEETITHDEESTTCEIP